MPNGDHQQAASQNNDNNTTESDALERLIAEAEATARVPVADKPRPCPHTTQPTLICPNCKWPFCEDCASPLDPNTCHICLPADTPLFEQKPLIDEDGVQHPGRVITPLPELRLRLTTTAKALSDMNTAELEAFITQYRKLVKDAELALDYRRITLNSAEMEQTERAAALKRKLRADKTKFPVRTVSIDKSTGKQAKPKTASTGQVMDMFKMLEAMQLLKQQAVAKQQQQQTVAAKQPTKEPNTNADASKTVL